MVDEETPSSGARWGEALGGVSRSVAGRLIGATVATAVITVLVKLLATARELVTAYELGAGDAVDAYLLALLVPSYVVNVVGSAFLSSLVPAFSAARARGGDEPQRIFSSALALAVGANLAICALLYLLAPRFYPFLANGFSEDKLALTRSLFLVLLPIALVSSVSFVMSSILNALERFAIVAFAPAMLPLAMLLGLVSAPEGREVYGLTWGTLLGSTLELSVLSIAARRLGYRLVPSWHASNASRIFAREYAYVAGGGLFICASVVVDQAFAASLEAGSVAVMNYASKIVALVTTLFSLSAGTTIFPIFSRLAARGELKRLRKAAGAASAAAFLLAWPVSAGLILLSEPIARLLFERGSFTSDNTAAVAAVQAVYALQIPFHAAGLILGRVLSALNSNRFLMHLGAASLFLNAFLDYLLIDSFGIAGIAWATVAVSAFLPAVILVISRWWIWPERLAGGQP